MKFPLFKEVALARDIPEEGLKKGDIAMVVDHHPASGREDGYSLEVFNALGETIVVTVVPESALESLQANQVLSARPLVKSA
jgi:uncharacterized protein DUF4926